LRLVYFQGEAENGEGCLLFDVLLVVFVVAIAFAYIFSIVVA